VKRFGLFLILVSAIADPALACRCAQKRLEEYFAAADVVFLGRAMSTWMVEGEPGHRAVRFEVQGSPYKGGASAFEHFATPLGSASCGANVETGRILLVFAAPREPGERVAWFDTCNGTRSFDAEAQSGVQGFVDVEPKFVLSALEARRIAAQSPGAAMLPVPGDPKAELIGLLEIPGVLDPGEEAVGTPFPPRTVPLYSDPADEKPVAQLRSAGEVVTREYGYEAAGAVVVQRRPGWLRISLPKKRSAWLREQDAGKFYPVAELLVNRLAYLNENWDGWVWPSPGAGHPIESPVARRPGRKEYPVNIVGSELIGGSLFLRVEVLDGDPCEGGEVKVQLGGWIPAYTPAGKLTAWFYSRGC
jgi:hypothetical protein